MSSPQGGLTEAQIQELIQQAVGKALATYHPAEAPAPPPETPTEKAHRLVDALGAQLRAESAVVSGSGRVHELTHALLAHIVDVLHPETDAAEAEPVTPAGAPDTTASADGSVTNA